MTISDINGLAIVALALILIAAIIYLNKKINRVRYNLEEKVRQMGVNIYNMQVKSGNAKAEYPLRPEETLSPEEKKFIDDYEDSMED